MLGRTVLATALGGAGLTAFVALGAAWAWSRPTLPPPVADAPPEYVAPVVAPERNALPAWQAAGKLLRLPPPKERADLWIALAEAKALPAAGAAVAASNQPALAALRAANRRPELQLMPPNHQVKTPLPELGGLQHLARVGAADVRRGLAAGDHAGALQRAADVLTMGRRMRQAPPAGLLFTLSGVVIDDLVHAAMRQDAKRVLAAPTPALAAFLRDLEALDRIERPLESGLIAERDGLVRTLRQGLDLSDKIDRETAEEFGVTRFSDATIAVVKNAFDRQIALVRARDVERAEAEARAPLADDSFKILVGTFLHRDATLGAIMASVALPSYGSSGVKAMNAEGRFDALRVWLAAELHRREHGAPPAALAALVPGWLHAAPPDPYDPARPMGYRAGTLWSVGPDRLDGGGKPELPIGPLRAGAGHAGDLVFLTPAGPR